MTSSGSGRFIVFEGGEGAGKSTQIRHLTEALTHAGIECVATREPGGTPQGEALRALFVRGDTDRWSPHAEALIAYAARQEHLHHVIRPALNDGKWVICDRFSLSTKVYQGHVGGVPSAFLQVLDDEIVGSTQPDLVIVLDVDPKIGLGRTSERSAEDAEETRFENKELAFHQKLREAFADEARASRGRVHLVSTHRPQAEVAAEIQSIVKTHFPDVAFG